MDVYDQQAKRWVSLRRARFCRRRNGRLRDLWVVLGVVVLFLPVIPQLVLTLLGVFFSFSDFDDGPYREL